MRLAWSWAAGAWLVGAGAVGASAACSSAFVSGGPPDAGKGNDGASTPVPDAGGADGTSVNTPRWPEVVLVDGLVAGTATDTTSLPITLDDVRVCIFDSNKSPLTPYALPDDAPMPLANYPGVRRGSGADLGSFQPGGTTLTVDVFPAAELTSDAVWVSNRSAYTCANIACDGGLPCQHHVELTVTVAEDVNVVALVDGPGGVRAVATAFLDAPYAGSPGSIYGGVVDFVGWHAGDTVAASYGEPGDAGASSSLTPIEAVVSPNTGMSPREITSQIASYDGDAIVFDALPSGDRFAQSLDSIAFVANAALDPPTFYAVRANFVLALVGDPNDPTSVQLLGGRNPAFDGRGLHVAAVSYATPTPR